MDLLDSIADYATRGANIYRSIANPQPVTQTAAPAPATTTAPAANSWTKYLPWVIGGVVVLVIIGLFARK